MPTSCNRRELLCVFAAAGAARWSESIMSAADLVPARTALDHLLLGVSDLDRGIAWVESRTGVRAAIGGSHPGVGTRNALLSLGGRQYLEIIAPDPAQSAFNFQIDIRPLTQPRLINWAAATLDTDAVAKNARAAGYSLFGPRDGSRARPDGKVLRWKSMGVLNQLGGQGLEPVPFFIEWAAGLLHPSQDSPTGCTLQSFELEHPDPAALMRALRSLGIEAKVRQAPNPRLIATLQTPQGAVQLS